MLRPIEYIEWYDAWNDAGWMDLEKAKTFVPPRHYARGWLVSEDETFIRICTNLDDKAEQITGLFIIPKGWIIKIVYGEVEWREEEHEHS